MRGQKIPTQQLTEWTEAARFHNMIEKHPDLRVVKTIPETQTVFFQHLSHGVTFEIPHILEQVEEHGAQAILDILEGRESPQRIFHITRIVGYYSRIRDWNKSKQAELRDRRKGQYALPAGRYQLGGTSDG